MFGKINQSGMENKKSFLYGTHSPDLIHTPIKLHEDILNSY